MIIRTAYLLPTHTQLRELASGVARLAEAMVVHGKLSLPIEMQQIIDYDRNDCLY